MTSRERVLAICAENHGLTANELRAICVERGINANTAGAPIREYLRAAKVVAENTPTAAAPAQQAPAAPAAPDPALVARDTASLLAYLRCFDMAVVRAAVAQLDLAGE